MCKRPGIILSLGCVLLVATLPLWTIGCARLRGGRPGGHAGASTGATLKALRLDDPIQAAAPTGAISLAAAKNAWTSFALELSGVPRPDKKHRYALRLLPLTRDASPDEPPQTIAVENFSAAQVISMPVEMNRAGYVRHTGLTTETRRLPRALLPLEIRSGMIDLSRLRDPASPADSSPHDAGAIAGPICFWIDLHIPPEAKAGSYSARCELIDLGARGDTAMAAVDVKLILHDFVIPDERHLHMVARANWEDLQRLYPERFEAIRPQLLSRKDPQYAPTIEALDRLVILAQKHRAELVIPRLQPLVKWHSSDRPPQITWDGLDSILAPWLNGDAFADRTPLGYWPLPAVDLLAAYEPKSRNAYWSEVAAHFDRNDWLARAPITLDKTTPGRASAVESIQLSADAQQILKAHENLRLLLPLEDDQLQFASDKSNPNLLEVDSTARLMTVSPGLVFNTPLQPWPADVQRPGHWLRTDLPGLLPYSGAGGNERDVRLWAWLGFLRQASLVMWGSPLPRTKSADEPADPNDLVWFYPGSWFGIDEPVPTVQLKWLRRAQQDFEYLWLARQRGEVINAMLMARLMAKPVEIQPNQFADPVYGLMCGTSDAEAWRGAERLLADTILLRPPGQAADSARRSENNLQMLRWAEPLEHPLLLGRTTQWLSESSDASRPGRWLSLRLGLDIYNASDMQPNQNLLQWTGAAPPWQIQPQPTPISALATYRVQRFNMDARFNLEQVGAEAAPMEVTFTDGFRKRQTAVRMVLPVAACDRRRPGLVIDGKLDDWTVADAMQHDRPLVRLLNRPALQHNELQLAATPSSIFSGWSDENLYVAFDVSGVSAASVTSMRNFIDYQLRRAWGEDIAQILVQPVYSDNTLGPVLHVACKPTGIWIERKTDPKQSVDPWQPFEGAAVRYFATMDPPGEGASASVGHWRGEVAIPWKIIADESKGRPRFLRFNFTQHRNATGESASWAGPIDYGRDDALTGLLYVRDQEQPGIGAAR